MSEAVCVKCGKRIFAAVEMPEKFLCSMCCAPTYRFPKRVDKQRIWKTDWDVLDGF